MDRPIHSLFDVTGKKVLVSGAARGNGRAIADGFVQAGAHVIYLDRSFSAEVRQDIPKGNLVHEMNVTDKAGLEKLLADIGAIDVLVNNAGITLSAEEHPDTYWDDTIAVNLTAAYHLALLAADGMKENGGGSIINITSISAHIGSAGNPAYHASKGGLRFLAKGLANDFGPYNVRVNNICPGYIRTSMTQKSFSSSERHKMISDRTMLARWGESEDLVGTCLFLASEASSYITGSDIMVDGGMVNKGF